MMIRSQLIERLAEKAPNLSTQDARIVVKTILDALSAALSQGVSVEIRGFGRFSIRHYRSHNAHNPKTRERIVTIEKYAPYFKPGKQLRERVDSE